MRVHLLGVRGSTPAPGEDFVRYGGHTSSVALGHDGGPPTLVLDAGTGIRRCTELLDGEAFDGTILLTHLHWDHVHGLPFFSAADRDDARTTVVLPDQLDGSTALAVLARGMSPPHFPVAPDELRGRWTFQTLDPGETRLEGFSVTAREIPHKGGRTFGYRVSDGRGVVAYLPDHCPSALGPGPDGWGEYHDAARDLAAGADVLIHDAQLVHEELAAEARYGHAAVEYAVALGRLCEVREVVLFHHKPGRTDEALDEITHRFGDDPRVIVASESMAFDL
ncbi:MAG: MBL fold metallo-hydrolase [Acidobacteriota bacterium]|nr:MBL fold metallo-hydrolase [Acidobacteriota bacterium]